MSRYVIWDKESNVITPIGEVLSPAEWIERYPVADVLDTVVLGSSINGGFFGVYSQMVDMYQNMGCDFTGCNSEQDYLDRIEEFEDEQNAPDTSGESTAEERIAAALELNNLMNMDVVNNDDPDL